VSDIGVITGQEKVRRLGNVPRIIEARNKKKKVWQEPEMEKSLGRHRCITYDNIKMHLKEAGYVVD